MIAATRRAVLAGAGALAACSRASAEPPAGPLPPLKAAAPFPLGVCAMSEQFDDLGWSELVRTHFDRVTPEWEMKAEAYAKPDGSYDFSRADRIVDAAARRGLSAFGHTIVWYSQVPRRFEALDGDRRAFAEAYRAYVTRVAGHFAGRVAGWDVVNEPVLDDGEGYRDCLWRRNLGMDYVRLAFEHAREADPEAVLFLNEYNLEQLPAKRADFLRLAESLLKAGAPIGGLGTQTHVPADLKSGAIRQTVRELGALGLKVHVSELDVSLNRGPGLLSSRQALLDGQKRIVEEAAGALLDLPPAQRWGLTVWGARDRDSWLRRPPENGGRSDDAPLLFDDEGRPKPVAHALAAALGR